MMLDDLAKLTSARFRALDQQSSVRDAADAFSDMHLGLIVVCDEAGRAAGVVSKSDLVRHMAHAGKIDAPVSLVMSRSLITAAPGDDLHLTWKMMAQRRLQNLPLLDADRRPVGILDIRDALEAIVQLEEDQDQLVNYISGVGYR